MSGQGTASPEQTSVALPLTKEDIVPFRYRIIGPKKVGWLFDIPRSYYGLLPPARNLDGDIIPGKYDLIDCIKTLLKGKTATRTNSTAAQLEAARIQKLRTEVERETIKNDLLKRSVVRVQDAQAEVADMILALRTHLMGYPSYVARLIIGKEDYDEVVRILTETLAKCLKDLQDLDMEAVKDRNRLLTQATADSVTYGNNGEIGVEVKMGIEEARESGAML